MSTGHLLDPQLAAAIEQLPRMLPLTAQTLNQRRVDYARLMDGLLPLLPHVAGVDVGEHFIVAGTAPAVRVLVYRPQHAAQRLPALLWIHGGGYVDGRADWDDYLARSLVSDVGCCVVSVDYRLAPETPFPGAIEDCYAALSWMHNHAGELGIDPKRIGVAGVSAGGGLAASLALLARDRGELHVSFQALLQPMLDDRHALDAYHHPFAGEFIWTQAHNHFGWSALLGHEPGKADVSPYAAAARAESLEGLPPAFIDVGALDLFVEENIEYARRLIRAGVPTELHVHPGACHAFQFLAPDGALAKAHQYNFINALRRHLAPAAGADHVQGNHV